MTGYNNHQTELDLNNLHKEITEKLQVNGRVKRKTRHRAAKSPPDGSSPSSPSSPRTGKCGRPANPIPRHKRDSHIKAEHKRRDKIQKGFESLRSLVPSLEDVSEKESKAVMLFKTAEYCRQLKGQCRGLTDEAAALRQEIQSVGTQIHDLQQELPVTGVDAVEEPPSTDIDQLYQQYVASQTKKNWKFYIVSCSHFVSEFDSHFLSSQKLCFLDIFSFNQRFSFNTLFSFMLKPLFESFKVMVTTTTSDDFSHSVSNWVKEKLALPNLRIEFLNCLRTVSKNTKIMDAPELLPVEAHLSCADKLCTLSDIKMEAVHTPLTIATPVNNSPPQLPSQSNVWVSSVLSTNTDLSTTYSSGNSMMSSSIVSDNCALPQALTEATMCTDSQELPLGPLGDIPLPTCDSEMSIVDSLLNNLDSSDSLHHLLSDQPVSLNDITPTPITEGFITHSQNPYTQTFTPHQGHQNAHYSL
uniref:BHLH domain-containing protein n=3 Tax=Magallana gigas TaxID=29159 RepID=A0A8W8J8W4_MAGGI